MPTPSPTPGTRDTDRDSDFWSQLLDDPDLLQAEFDAIVAAEWPDRPTIPPRRGIPGRPHPGNRTRDWSPPCRWLRGCRCEEDRRPRQRSPPDTSPAR